MVEKVEYFCDVCGRDITDETRHTCGICGRTTCVGCYISLRGWKEMWLTTCDICRPIYEKIKEKMDIDYKKHDNLHKEYCGELYTKWKKESLLIPDATGIMDINDDDVC